MAVKTQGTEMWAYNPATKELLDMGCVTSIDGIDSTIEQIETTCLNSLDRTYEAGLSTPGQASFEIQFDPRNPDHVKIHAIKEAGITLDWFIGFRYELNGVPVVPGPAPEVATPGDEIELPEERSWILFKGYMSGFPFGFNQNDVVRSGITVQISGKVEVVPATTP